MSNLVTGNNPEVAAPVTAPVVQNKAIQDMANKIMELQASGMSLEDALGMVQPKAPAYGSRPVIADRVTWISSLQSIAEVRKATKVAFAKRSKAAGKPETEARYQLEIDAGKARLNELLADVNSAPIPYLRALELGEEVSGVLQRFIGDQEEGLEDAVKLATPGMTVTGRKELINSQPTETPWDLRVKLLELGDDYLEKYEERAEKGDQRIIILNKRYGFVAMNPVNIILDENAPVLQEIVGGVAEVIQEAGNEDHTEIPEITIPQETVSEIPDMNLAATIEELEELNAAIEAPVEEPVKNKGKKGHK